MQEALRSPRIAPSETHTVLSPTNGNGNNGFSTDFGEVLSPIHLDELAPLKRAYASLLVQLDFLRPKLAAPDSLPTLEGEWSVREILGHIVDTDRDIWWPRITAILQQGHPTFKNIDPKELVQRHNWKSLPIEEILAQLMRTRWNFAMKLEELSQTDFEKTGSHPTLGEISILRILQILVAHDTHYIEEIRALTDDFSPSSSN